MRLVFIFLLWLCLGFSSFAQDEAESKIYFLSFKDFSYSFSQQIEIAPFTHHARSEQKATYYTSPANELLPSPVYNRAYSFGTLTYRPLVRLVEIGSKLSFSFSVPMSLALSTVDLRTREGNRYTFPGASQFDLSSGTYTYNRPSAMGFMSAEIGGLFGFNVGAQSTIENINSAGFSVAAGYNLIAAPLFMDSFTNQERSDYRTDFRWGSLVGQLGVNGRVVSLIYMFGIRPTRIHYQDSFGQEVTVMTNSYHRVSMGFKIGK